MDVAQAANLAESAKDKVKRARKLLKEQAELQRRLNAVNAELQALANSAAAVHKGVVSEEEDSK